jgi:hypothetical protein
MRRASTSGSENGTAITGTIIETTITIIGVIAGTGPMAPIQDIHFTIQDCVCKPYTGR